MSSTSYQTGAGSTNWSDPHPDVQYRWAWTGKEMKWSQLIGTVDVSDLGFKGLKLIFEGKLKPGDSWDLMYFWESREAMLDDTMYMSSDGSTMVVATKGHSPYGEWVSVNNPGTFFASTESRSRVLVDDYTSAASSGNARVWFDEDVTEFRHKGGIYVPEKLAALLWKTAIGLFTIPDIGSLRYECKRSVQQGEAKEICRYGSNV